VPGARAAATDGSRSGQQRGAARGGPRPRQRHLAGLPAAGRRLARPAALRREVEPCINGRLVAIGSYFGEDVQVVVDRLLGEQMADGGWNCEQENGSTRGSFHS